ncbi:MAG: gamma-glutamylcyclotransferase [Candidatus Brockarchaeota archaeon]|nr:gamma-glutamylcyclotransferase [Candidatus Brockarchaeota archaeon]
MDSKLNYFAYGSNMDTERILERGVRFSKSFHAVLEGWKLEFNKISYRNPNEGFANIVPCKGNFVEGVLYEINSSALSKLDKYEGYPEHYKRIKVQVRLDNGMQLEAVTYVANPKKIRDGLKPSREYLNHLLKGCDLLSKEYCEKLRLQETLD